MVVGTSPVVVCPSQQDASLTNMPANAAALDAVIPFPIFTPGTSPADDLVVAAGATEVLDPTTKYGRIVLMQNARLVLPSAGNYDVLSIATEGIRGEETRAYIDVESENVNLNVKEYLALGHRSRVNQAGTRLFRIYVEGGDNNTIDTWYADVTGFDFRGDGTFNACFVYSPEATQTWRGRPYLQTSYTTQAFAKNFAQNFRDKLLIRFEHPQDPECFEIPPEYVCATIGRVIPPGVTCDSVSGVVSLPAWNASETSLSYVGLIREDAALPLAPTVSQFIDASCVMFPSGPSIPLLPGVDPNPLTYSPPGEVENVIQTPDIWAAGVLTNPKPECPDNPDVRLVPFALGPIVEGNVDRPPVCFSAATFQFLKAESPDTCTMVDP